MPTPVEPVVEEARLPPNPLEAAADKPRPERPKRTSMKDISQSLDRLLANAPDELPPEEQAFSTPPKKKEEKPKEEEKKPEGPSQAEQIKQAQEEFYNDPLIQEALNQFEATIVTS